MIDFATWSSAQLTDLSDLDISSFTLTHARELMGEYLRLNYTGPFDPNGLSAYQQEFAHHFGIADFGAWDKTWAMRMTRDAGEDFTTRQVRCVSWLGLAIEIAYHLESNVDSVPLLIRLTFLQQQLFENPSDKLLQRFTGLIPRLPNVSDNMAESERADAAEMLLLRGLIHHYYRDNKAALETFQQAERITGLQHEVTGALGRRTQFQSFDIAQLTVFASSQNELFPEMTAAPQDSDLPQALNLNDDTLLEDIKLTHGDRPQEALLPIDQCILLALCLNVKNSNPAHGLTTEQMMPFVRRVLAHPRKTLIHSMALLLRSRLESESSRTVERSLFQLQVLVDQMLPSEGVDVKQVADQRQQYFFAIAYPGWWELRKEFADRLVKLGALRSALEVYEGLEMWENVINCLVILEEEVKAEKVIREQLERDPESPRLLCILGDLKRDPSYWQRAWDVSGQRYARAMRSLGSWHYHKQDFKSCVECYQKALEINSLFENSWFTLGCAAMQVEDWDEARRAFTRCVMLEQANAEAWNNLSAIHIREGRKLDAFRCLREGLKEKFESWKMWENFMFLALDLKEFADALSAMDRLLDLRWKQKGAVDVKAVVALVDGVVLLHTESDPTNVGQQHHFRLIDRCETVLKKCVDIHADNADLWTIAADFYRVIERSDQELEARLSAYRSVSQSDVADKAVSEQPAFEQFATVALALCQSYIEAFEQGRSTRGNFQAKIVLRNLGKKTADAFDTHELYHQMQEMLDSLSQDTAGR
jgi:tetratricopeptide (TPR) repeat protein